MRTKNFIFLLALVIILSVLLIVFSGPSDNENIANIQNLANKQFRQIKVEQEEKKVEKIFYFKIIALSRKTCEWRGKSWRWIQNICNYWAISPILVQAQLAAQRIFSTSRDKIFQS